MAVAFVNAANWGSHASVSTLTAGSTYSPAAAGNLLIVVVGGGQSATPSTFSDSGQGLTWTPRVNTTATASTAPAKMWTAVAASTAAMTFTATFTGGGDVCAMTIMEFSGAGLAATPATAQVTGDASVNYSGTITTVGTGSVVAYAGVDYNGIGTAPTLLSSATQATRYDDPSQVTEYAAYQAAATAGSKTFGASAPTGCKYSFVAIEVQVAATTPVTEVETTGAGAARAGRSVDPAPVIGKSVAAVVDTFTAGTIDPQWTAAYGVALDTTAHRMSINAVYSGGAPAYAGLKTDSIYTLAGSGFYFKMPLVPGGPDGYAQAFANAPSAPDGGTRWGFEYVNGSLILAVHRNYYDQDGLSQTLTYDATNHLWLWMTHDGTNLKWWGSPDGSTWSQLGTSVTAPATSSAGDLNLSFEGFRNSGTGANDIWQLDNVNAPAADPVTLPDGLPAAAFSRSSPDGQLVAGVVLADPAGGAAARAGVAVDGLIRGTVLADGQAGSARSGLGVDQLAVAVVLTGSGTPGAARSAGTVADSLVRGVTLADAAAAAARAGLGVDQLALDITAPAAGTPGAARVGRAADSLLLGVTIVDKPGGQAQARNTPGSSAAVDLTAPDTSSGGDARAGLAVDQLAVDITLTGGAAGVSRVGRAVDSVSIGVTVTGGAPGASWSRSAPSDVLLDGVTLADGRAAVARSSSTGADSLVRGVVKADTAAGAARAGRTVDVLAVGVVLADGRAAVAFARSSAGSSAAVDLSAPDPSGAAAARAGVLADGIVTDKTAADPTGAGAARVGIVALVVDAVEADPAIDTPDGVARAWGENPAARVVGMWPDDYPGSYPGLMVLGDAFDVLIRDVVLDPSLAPHAPSAARGPVTGAGTVNVGYPEPGAVRAAAARSTGDDKILGATSGRLSNLPILRVLYRRTGIPPQQPATNADGDTVDLTEAMAVTELAVRRGRQYELGQCETGTATVTLQDHQELLNPENTTSPYNTPDAPLRSYRPMRVTAVWGGVAYGLFTGYVERYPQTWIHQGFHGVKPLEGIDLLGVLANISVRQSYFETVMADVPTLWIPFNDASAPGTVYLASPQALVANGTGQPGNPREGTSAYYQQSLLAAGHGMRLDEQATNGGEVQWGGGKFLDGSSAVTVSSTRPQQGSTDTSLPIGLLTIAGGSLCVDMSSSTIELWFRHTVGTVDFCLFSCGAMRDGDASQPLAGLLTNSDGQVYFVVQNPAALAGAILLPARTGFVAGGPPEDTWHYAAITFLPTGAGTFTVEFQLDDQVRSMAGIHEWNNYLRFGATYVRTAATSQYGDPTSSGQVFGLAYYPYPLARDQRMTHYRRGTGWIGEASGDRSRRLLAEYLDTPPYWDGNSPGTVAMDADFDYGVYLAPGDGQDNGAVQPYSVLEALQEVDVAEQGFIHVTSDGGIIPESRRYRATQVVDTIYVLGDRPELGELPYTVLEYDFDPTYVYTQTQLSKASGGQSITQDGDQSVFGTRVFSATVQLAADWDLFQLGMFLLARYGEQRLRVRRISLDPAANPDLWPFVLGVVEVSARIRVNRRTSTGLLISADYFIEHVEHDVNAKESTWVTNLQLSPAYYQGPQGMIGDATHGVLGSTTTIVY